MAALADLFRALDELRSEETDRESFWPHAGPYLDLANLAPGEHQAARTRISELADELSSRLITPDDLASATRICRATAKRLRSAPWFEELLTNWPGPIAHEIRTLANMLDGTGREGRPTAEGALAQLRELQGALWIWRAEKNRGNARQDARGFGPRAAIADYDQAIVLMETLARAGRCFGATTSPVLRKHRLSGMRSARQIPTIRGTHCAHSLSKENDHELRHAQTLRRTQAAGRLRTAHALVRRVWNLGQHAPGSCESQDICNSVFRAKNGNGRTNWQRSR